jgi:hypothetical protein
MEKMHFLVIKKKKNLLLKRYKIGSTNYFSKKILMNNTNIFDLIWLILILNKFEKVQKFCFSLDPDPDWAKMLDPYWINPDPHPVWKESIVWYR